MCKENCSKPDSTYVMSDKEIKHLEILERFKKSDEWDQHLEDSKIANNLTSAIKIEDGHTWDKIKIYKYIYLERRIDKYGVSRYFRCYGDIEELRSYNMNFLIELKQLLQNTD